MLVARFARRSMAANGGSNEDSGLFLSLSSPISHAPKIQRFLKTQP
jgi:hypothetical protein